MDQKPKPTAKINQLAKITSLSKINSATQYGFNFGNPKEEHSHSARSLRPNRNDIYDSNVETSSMVQPTRLLTHRSTQPDIPTNQLEFSSGVKKTNLPSFVTSDRFDSANLEKRSMSQAAADYKNPERSANTPKNLNLTQNAFHSDYAINPFYLTSSKPDTNKFRLKSFKKTNLTAQEFRNQDDLQPTERITNLSTQRIQTGYGVDASTAAKVNLVNFYETLPVSIRNFFADKKDFMKIFEEYSLANFCMDEVIMKVKCYRAELGGLLQKVASTHRKLFEKLLDSSMKLFHYQDVEIEKKLREIKENLKKVEFEKEDLLAKHQNFKHLFSILESSSKVQMMSIEKLESEIRIAHQLSKHEVHSALHQKHHEKQKNEELMGHSHERGMKEYSEKLQDDVGRLQEHFEELDREHIIKTKIIKDMNNHLKATLKKMKYDVGTQVDDGELAWAANHLRSLNDDHPVNADFAAIESATVNVEDKLKQQIDSGDKLEGVDPKNIVKLKDKELKTQIDSELGQTEAKKKNPGLITMSQAQNMIQEFENNWNLPLNMIIFLENITKSGENARVLPWAYFKRIIFEIYNDRIKNRIEIENSLINTFVPLSEYTCLYFLKKYQLRRTAELKLLEFLVSLKYYVKIWPRAQTFAKMCNIIGVGKSRDPQDVVNTYEYDIYLQNFVIFAFERIVADPASLIDHSEGTTWVIKERLEDIANSILVFQGDFARKKFLTQLQQQYRFIGEGPDKDAEGVDVDKLLLAFIDEYVEAKRKNIKAMTKYFYKNNQDMEKVLSIEDFGLALQEVNDTEPTVANLMYPKDLTISRAFLYAITSGTNTYSINYKQFIASMVRFGLDCPFPYISFGADEQRQFEYQAAMLASGLVKKKNFALKKGRGLQGDNKKRYSGMKANTDPQREESPIRLSERASEVRDPRGSKKETEFKLTSGVRLDSVSSLFSQHFSILRELNSYCQQFNQLLEEEEPDQEILAKSFRQIAKILETGCEFLRFPVKIL